MPTLERLTRWLQQRKVVSQERVSLEEALLGGRFLRYARYRLVGFALSRLLGALTHVLEFTFLLSVFRARGVIASLGLQNAGLLVEAFWWGCLEIIRAHIRAEVAKSAIVNRITRWLTWSLRLGLVALVVPCAISLTLCLTEKRRVNVLDAYALVCGARLAIDLVARTYYSGIYAL